MSAEALDEPVLKPRRSKRKVYHRPDPDATDLEPACWAKRSQSYHLEEREILDERSRYRPCRLCYGGETDA